MQDIKPSLTPPPNASPPGFLFTADGEMESGGGSTSQPAAHGPTPPPPRNLYDPTLYPRIDPVVPKRGRARALDFEPIDDPPAKKRRVNPLPKSVSTPAPQPPPQPKQTTLFTANKSGPISRTRDGKFVPVPTLPKPPKWGLSPEERAALGLEPFIATKAIGESPSRDGGSSIGTSDSNVYLDMNTPRNQVRRRSCQSPNLLVDYTKPYGSQVQVPLQRVSTKLPIRTLSLKITRTTKLTCVWALMIGICALFRILFSFTIIPVHRTPLRSCHPRQVGLAHHFLARHEMEEI
jgi:hypothetical protein